MFFRKRVEMFVILPQQIERLYIHIGKVLGGYKKHTQPDTDFIDYIRWLQL